MGSGLYLECANIFLDNTTIPNGISNVSGSEFQIQIFKSCQGPCRHFESAGRPIFFLSGRVLFKKNGAFIYFDFLSASEKSEWPAGPPADKGPGSCMVTIMVFFGGGLGRF